MTDKNNINTWSLEMLSYSPHISWDWDILSNINTWSWEMISYNPYISWDTIEYTFNIECNYIQIENKRRHKRVDIFR